MSLDILILCIPIRKVFRLHLPRTQKFAVILTFLLGSFVCFASMYRIITIVMYADSVDMSWTKSDVFIWSLVEPSVGIISACLPTLRPLLTRGLEKAGVSGGSSGRGESEGVNLVETISSKRTRRVDRVDVLDETLAGTQWDKNGEEEERWKMDEEALKRVDRREGLTSVTRSR